MSFSRRKRLGQSITVFWQALLGSGMFTALIAIPRQGANAQMVVGCRCEFPDESFYPTPLLPLETYEDNRLVVVVNTDTLVQDNNRYVIPRTDPVCNNVEFTCPFEPIAGPPPNFICVDFPPVANARGGKRNKLKGNVFRRSDEEDRRRELMGMKKGKNAKSKEPSTPTRPFVVVLPFDNDLCLLTEFPTVSPEAVRIPTTSPVRVPTIAPTQAKRLTAAPSRLPTNAPKGTTAPSKAPSKAPAGATKAPTGATKAPTGGTKAPIGATNAPTSAPTELPSSFPTSAPTVTPVEER
jgi:hypothetical protein